MLSATGTFDVKTIPQPPEEAAGGDAIGRLLLDKQFHGELEAKSVGTMLGARSAVQGSAGYVAIEKLTGSLKGRSGSFLLLHSGVMNRGAMEQSVSVIPDSGEGELAGISGRMTIEIKDGAHHYRLDYNLP
jgi:hypothetical protein